MNSFFQARSVAVVGVSNSAGNLGRIIAYNLMEFRYGGYVHLVGPKGGSFLGHKIHPSVLDIPDPVDLAAVLVPASAVPQVLRQCGEKGIRRVVVQSAGFRELGGERLQLEEEVLHILDQYKIRMIGPNCIGIINRDNGLAVPFMPFKAEAAPGRVAVISQSGGVGAMMVNSLALENIGFSKFASIGNKLNVNEADLIEYLVGEDDKTDIIYCYLEGVADGRRLMQVASRSTKPIIVHKSNNGASGAVIAQSHSASLSSDDAIVDAAFRQCGIHRTREQREAMDLLRGFVLPNMKGNRLAVISRSGGHAVMAADAAEGFDFVLPPFPDDLIRLVHQESRANVIQLHNPLDLGDLFNLPLYRTLVEKTLERDDIDGVLFIHNYQGIFDSSDSRRLIAGMAELMEKRQKPVAVCVFTTQIELEYNRKAVRFPIFTDPMEAVRALALNRDRGKIPALPFATERPFGVNIDLVQSELAAIPSGPIPPEKLARLLAAYGIPLVEWKEAEDESGALAAGRALGFPVVMKTAQPEVVHKSDAGGVILNIMDEEALSVAYRDLSRLGSRVLLQKMSAAGLEWLVGGRRDRQFGPAVVAGMGGIYVEVFKETSIRIGPIGCEEANRLLDDCRGAALLGAVRGQPSLDRPALADLIVRVSWLLADFPEIGELDLNPVRIFAKGCQALDWRARKQTR
jgi:acetyltransferase